MLLTNEHCEVSCPNYEKNIAMCFSPTLLKVHFDMCSSRHPQPERSDVFLPQNQDYYVFDHHHAALRRVLCNYWEDGVSRVED